MNKSKKVRLSKGIKHRFVFIGWLLIQIFFVDLSLANANSPTETQCKRTLAALSRIRFYSKTFKDRLVTTDMADYDSAQLAKSYHTLLSDYLRFPKNRNKLTTFLEGKSGALDEAKLPQYLVRIINRLSQKDKNKLLALIPEEMETELHFYETRDLLLKNMTPLKSAGKEYKEALSDYARFFKSNHDLESIRLPNGGINIAALLTTGGLSSDATVAIGGRLVTVGKMRRNTVTSINYVICRDKKGKAFMKLAPIDKRDKEWFWGIRVHSFVAEGEEVEFSGTMNLTDDGKVQELTLDSGHYMRPRQKELDRHIGNKNAKLSALSVKKDEDALRKVIEKELRLPTENLQIRVRFR